MRQRQTDTHHAEWIRSMATGGSPSTRFALHPGAADAALKKPGMRASSCPGRRAFKLLPNDLPDGTGSIS